MTYIRPANLLRNIIDAGESKVKMSALKTIVRSYMAGAILAIAAAFEVTVTINTGQPLMGAILFPVGFILLAPSEGLFVGSRFSCHPHTTEIKHF